MCLHQQVHMIGHEAVDNDSELLFLRRSHDLREHEIDAFARREQVVTMIRAETERVAMETEVVKIGQPFGSPSEHGKPVSNQ